ncbi:DUF2809 domain-containing protein [Streptomyces sp. NPDC085946]|uniref:DUF2809 domain-containing protein n=1 Tax=Streptomyces sp. NPDC085946 TaxID=3365744 RepID=UPI0037D435D6
MPPPSRAVPARALVRTRCAAAAAALVIVGAGLGLRAVATGGLAKYGGDALYTLMTVALVVLAAPRTAPPKAARTALALSWGIEFLQLTGVPAELSRHSTAARLILGSTFDAPDLLWYAVGALAGRPLARALAAAGPTAGRGPGPRRTRAEATAGDSRAGHARGKR